MRYPKTLLLLFVFINSCSYPEISRDDLIYNNDFESDNFIEIDGKATSTFNNTTVLGDFNNDGFTDTIAIEKDVVCKRNDPTKPFNRSGGDCKDAAFMYVFKNNNNSSFEKKTQ